MDTRRKKIANFIQTNATLIDCEWTNFFAENNFITGVSLDGPKRFHDKTRYYPDLKGTYNCVMESINLLREAEIFNGVICGITAKNYKYPNEIFNFFISENIKKLKFGRIKDIGCCDNISTLTISSKQYFDFLIAVFDLWLKYDDPEIEIRDIQSVVNLILGGNKRECIYMGKCDQFVTVYSDGSIYSCDSFPKIDSLYFGNVFEKPNKTTADNNLRLFQKMITEHKKYCQKCNWYFICRGGCTRDYYSIMPSVESINNNCNNLKRYFNYIFEKIKSCGLI